MDEGSLDDSGVLRVLFENGVSTAEQVTESSGRGAGLSAVLAAARALGGDVSLRNGDVGAIVEMRMPAKNCVIATH
jgi:chemotaxis protein histidine kinase CheA